MFRTIKTISTGILLATAGCGLSGDADDAVTESTVDGPRSVGGISRKVAALPRFARERL